MILSDDQFKNIFPFPKPRNNQRETIEKILEAYQNGKKYVILNAPTGTGKSVIGYTVARYFGTSYILTSQKILQEQYYNDFKIPYVLGKANYTCQKNNAFTCDIGMCANNPKRRCVDGSGNITCPYLVARDKCLTAPHSNLNYSFFLTAAKIPDFLMSKELVICDETHNLEEELIKTCSLRVDDNVLKRLGVNVKLPALSTSDESKCSWLCHEFYDKIKNEFAYVHGQTQSLKDMKSTREYKKISIKHEILKNMIEQIDGISRMLEAGEIIVISHEKDFIEFKILHANTIFSESIARFGNRFLFMSASILNYKTFIKDLGISEKYVEYIECDSSFPVENRLIHYNPVGSMSFRKKDETLPLMIKKIDSILKTNKDVKGIIHTVNYDVANKIIEGLKFSDQYYRLLMPKGQDRSTVLNVFYKSEKPYVLISPSLTEGIDLKEDLSRLCIICKVPYANLKDKWTSIRMNENNVWYTNKACISLVQMTGRSIRSETDFATTYILDSDFMTLAQRALNIFPKWWQESVVMN